MRLCTLRASPGCAAAPNGDPASFEIIALGDDQPTLARLYTLNPLTSFPPAGSTSTDHIIYSGSLSSDPSAPHPANWLAPGREALDLLCAELCDRSDAGRTICFQPHSRHILNDVPSSLKFLEDHAGEPFSLALNPVLLIEPMMIDAIEDHLSRIFQGLGARARYLLLTDLDLDPRTGDRAALQPLGQGRLPRELMRSLIAEFIDEATPVVMLQDDLDGQIDWLGP